MTELKYVGNLKRIEDEVNLVKRTFHGQHAVNEFGRSSFENEKTLNQNAAFWNLHCHSCHVTAIMCLSRIFDSSGYSVHKLLIDSVDNLAFFSKKALRGRKLTNINGVPDWLDQYMQNVWVPDQNAFEAMKRDLEPHTKCFRKYKTIRDKIYGHSAMDPNSSFALYKDATIAEVDEIIHFLHDLVRALRNLWDNGEQPVTLGADDYNYQTSVQSIREETFQLLRRL